MGSIEKPLSATSGFEYLSNDKPILSRHYSASVLLPVKEVSAGRDEPACVGQEDCAEDNVKRISKEHGDT